MDIRQAYSRWAPTYDVDRNLTRDLDHAVTEAVLAALAPTSILELGCGTGKNSSFLASIGRRVCGLDFSSGMLRQAQARLHAANILLTLADITSPWPCAAQTMDLVVCNLILEHIAQLDFIFAQARRVLQPGGHLFISELHPFRQYQGKKAVFQAAHTQIEIPAFVHHISDFWQGAEQHGLHLQRLQEWWHMDDDNAPPRLISFLFQTTD